MVVEIRGLGLLGVAAIPLVVEADVPGGDGGVVVVGIGNAEDRECGLRVRSALNELGVTSRARVNVCVRCLDGGNVPPLVGAYDLTVAVAVLAALEHVPLEAAHRFLYHGELSLAGVVRGGRGTAALARAAHAVGLPMVCASERAYETNYSGASVYTVRDLFDLVALLRGQSERKHAPSRVVERGEPLVPLEAVDSPLLQRAFLVAAAGGHHLLVTGRNGATMYATRALRDILPAPTDAEAQEILEAYSLGGLASPALASFFPPYRAPHHTASAAGLCGSFMNPRPPEAALAHRGVLALHDAAEFTSDALDGLRSVMQRGIVSFRSGQRGGFFPAEFLLVASMPSCPCGRGCSLTGPARHGSCHGPAVSRYRERVRRHHLPFGIFVDLDREDNERRGEEPSAPPPFNPRFAVSTARAIARDRNPRGVLNGALTTDDLQAVFSVGRFGNGAQELLESQSIVDRLPLLRLALTFADLSSSARIECEHVRMAVALVFRDDIF